MKSDLVTRLARCERQFKNLYEMFSNESRWFDSRLRELESELNLPTPSHPAAAGSRVVEATDDSRVPESEIVCAMEAALISMECNGCGKTGGANELRAVLKRLRPDSPCV